MSTLLEIPFHGTTIHAINDEGKPLVSLRHACEAIGLSYSRQFDKLKSKPWSTVALKGTVGADGKHREMSMIDRRTLTMWLATIEPSRVKEGVRDILIAYQNEAADALDAYFHEGGAINPNASVDQLSALSATIKAQGEALQALSPFLSPKFLESKAKILAARALGEAPEIDPLDIPLHAEDYLRDRGLSAKDLKSVRSPFGRRVAKIYEVNYGKKPEKATHEVNGSIRMINAYTERDRDLFDHVWFDHYADLYEPTLMEELQDA